MSGVLDKTHGITMSYWDAIFANQRKLIPIIANEFELQIIGIVESNNCLLNQMVDSQLLALAIHRFCGRAKYVIGEFQSSPALADGRYSPFGAGQRVAVVV